ncbi:MAG: VOC family protein [Hyphomicrobium sp.]
MQTAGMAATSVVPLMRYRDCATAIDWLVRAFGFERHFVLGSEDGKVVFAQLTCGSGMIMVGPVGDSDLDDHLKQPDEVGGAATQSCYLAVDDIEEHYRRARACGAEIVLDLKGAAFGSQGYSCRDLEGHIWNFGSYDPWRGKRQPEVKLDAPPPRRRGLVRDLVMLGLCGSALLVAVSTFGKGGWSNTLNAALGRPTASAAPALPSSDHGERLRSLEAALLGATADINATRQKLNGAESGRSAAEAAVADLRLELERERAGRLRAEEGANAAVEKIAEDVRRELAIY